jgi:hypothetical protein
VAQENIAGLSCRWCGTSILLVVMAFITDLGSIDFLYFVPVLPK